MVRHYLESRRDTQTGMELTPSASKLGQRFFQALEEQELHTAGQPLSSYLMTPLKMKLAAGSKPLK